MLQPGIDEYGYPTRPASQRKLRNVLVHSIRDALLKTIYSGLSVAGLALRLKEAGKRKQPLNPATFHPRRILILRLDLIGDLVMSTTVLRLLKRTYPDAEIDLMATPSSAALLRNDPDIADLISYDPNIWRRPRSLFQQKNWQELRSLLKRLRDRHYDLAISVYGPWAAILSVLSGAPRRIGFAEEGYPGFMTDPIAGRHWRPGDRKHEVDYCLQLGRAAGAQPTEADRIPHIFVEEQARQEARALLQQHGWRPGTPLIACHVSSHNGQSKRWPIPYWAALVDRLIHDDGYTVVFTGTPQDQPIIEAVLQRMRERPLNLAGKTNLIQLAALLQQADILITGDSGPMHIGAAVGTNVIAIHGPTDPTLSGPISPRATVLTSDIWCRPCYTAEGPADCRFFTTQCMKDISPARVRHVVHARLQPAANEANA
ncbi:3-deoxy-D-manno-octulosonic-acid transferase/heptosyltransferase-3 [Thermosporothrix hazakensis]|jgi:lipopolysaccharide heptosyltransferase II|uniref:lipopolysaccharide heptosyltransferase II n=1 Tax=Thermosporothrix hazakensis TaxID=644383 RepID=A0A326UHY4_THEHA|nr:lipopolysaccharide heptosyltransferase II [Thermosporothrix hazakensis]PZW36460.1 3-deoxy-D-manno-octulosonic-acid transferase/heptosyltransferase-3 [Thermosporothrix hazakensis]GCE47115.1 ADP-heptose--LPS heptosyltransferase [Thermosporothrix hazakensis]